MSIQGQADALDPLNASFTLADTVQMFLQVTCRTSSALEHSGMGLCLPIGS